MGPKGSGKSLLLQRLRSLATNKELSPFEAIPITRPTTGIETNGFRFRGLGLNFKELGGASISEWLTHAKTQKSIVYVFDSADLTATAANVVWLHQLLTNEDVQDKPILVVLSRCDIPEGIKYSVMDELIGFQRMRNPGRISFLETSAVAGVGLGELFHWIGEHLK